MDKYGSKTHVDTFLRKSLFGLCFVLWLSRSGHIWSEIFICMVVEVLYIFHCCLFGLHFFVDIHDHLEKSQMSSKWHILFVLLRPNPYVSNMCILDQNSRLPSHTICVTYLDYISLLLICGNFPLTLNMVVCWNMLESYPYRIPLIDSSQKWTRIIFIISNSKLGKYLCSQPTIKYVVCRFSGLHSRQSSENNILWYKNITS